MKNDLHNFARYGNRLSTESSRFLQFVLVIDTFTTKWKCVLQNRHVASLLKVRVGQPPPKKNLDRQKKLNKIKKNLKNLEKKNSWGRGCVVFLVTPISLLSSFFSLPFSIITCSQKSWGREQFHMHDILYFYLSI